jgi:hypothetical protein
MAKIIDLSKDNFKSGFVNSLQRAIQSAHLNFLIGSGCSRPAIAVLGDIEREVTDLKVKGEEDEATRKLYSFLVPLVKSTASLVTDTYNDEAKESHKSTFMAYSNFLKLIAHLIFERKGSLLPKQASIFTTNYDLFMEKASDYADGTYYLNDGFVRNPSLTNSHVFSTSEFFVSRKKRGFHYDYEVEVPSINLLKLHGSFSWKSIGGALHFSSDMPTEFPADSDLDKVNAFNDGLSVILPNKEKFRDTLLNQTYYDLLRIYSNELEKKNSLLFAIGFSFADEHLLDLTKRALRNPTLKLVIFCFNQSDVERFSVIFSAYPNVELVYDENEDLPFSGVISLLETIHIADRGNS